VLRTNRPDPQPTPPISCRWQSWDARLREPGPWHTRIDHPDGTKDVVWSSFGEHKLADLIYGGELVTGAHADSLIVLTEGEKSADAVRDAGFIAAGTVCGAASTPGDAVLGLFRDRHVVLWPDADMVGAKHMSRIATRLEILGVKSLSLVTWDAAQDHDDAADAGDELIGFLVTTPDGCRSSGRPCVRAAAGRSYDRAAGGRAGR
jgi:hypothetical protein